MKELGSSSRKVQRLFHPCLVVKWLPVLGVGGTVPFPFPCPWQIWKRLAFGDRGAREAPCCHLSCVSTSPSPPLPELGRAATLVSTCQRQLQRFRRHQLAASRPCLRPSTASCQRRPRAD